MSTTTTALDRYRAAKNALDTFDAFTKTLRWPAKGDQAYQAPYIANDVTFTVSNPADPRFHQFSQTQFAGFNRFVAQWVMNERLGLAAEYRETLVVAASKAKIEADNEARALMRENSPI